MNHPKSFSKKLLAILLTAISVLMLLPAASLAAVKYPTVYIVGQGQRITTDKTLNGTLLYPVEIPDGYLEEVGKPLISPLMNGIFLNRWTEYNEGLYAAVSPFTAPLALGKDGLPADNSGTPFKNSTNAYPPYSGSTFRQFSFNYDWRLDPVDVADQLHDYVLKIKKAQKAQKVNIIARCLGAEIMLAYFDKYGAQDINDCLFCCLGFDGFDTIGAIFAGDIELNAKAIDRFVNLYLSTEDYAGDPTFDLLKSLVTVLRYNLTLDLTADVCEKLIRGVKDDAFRRIMTESLATMPSFWSYIGDDYYEDAKAFLFGGLEDDYAGLIEKIDYYHYHIMDRYAEILDAAETDGARFYNVCKYGFQNIPVLGKDDTMSDLLIRTEYSSLGATCAPIDSVLPASYLSGRDAKYISPDKQIDASTCRYPEHTWFIKNMTHRNMPECIDDLFDAIITFDGYTTVDDLEEYPQFLISSDDASTISPADKENSDLMGRVKTNIFKAFFNFFKKLFAFLKQMLAK